MNIKENIETAKPFVIGGVVGAVAALAIAFAGGFVVTSSTMNDTVRDARVMALAQVCQGVATEHWLAEGNSADGLSGWRNEARTALAERFVPTTADAELRADISNACGRLLRTS